MPVNKEHLLKIKQHILEEPNRLIMSDWLQTELTVGSLVIDEYVEYADMVIDQTVPNCGTVACICGWSAALRKEKEWTPSNEVRFLGLDSDALFFPDYWPEYLNKRYTNATTPLEKAQVAAEAIDLIIAGDGVFLEEQEL